MELILNLSAYGTVGILIFAIVLVVSATIKVFRQESLEINRKAVLQTLSYAREELFLKRMFIPVLKLNSESELEEELLHHSSKPNF